MSAQPKRFAKRRWRRPERLTLDHGPVVRRKDLGVSEPLPLEPELARRTSRHRIQALLGALLTGCLIEGLGVGTAVGHPFLGAGVGIAFAALYFLVARELGDGWIVRALGAQPVAGPRTVRLAAAEARTAGIPAPRVLVAPGEVPNAVSFALRRRWLVTTKACEEMDELALEGLVAHEIIHLRDGDASVASLFCVLAGAPDLLLRGAGPALVIALPIWPVAFAMRALRSVALPEGREHRADVAAALLTRYPPGMVAALEQGGGRPTGLRLLDPCWFVARDGSSDATGRAALIAEM